MRHRLAIAALALTILLAPAAAASDVSVGTISVYTDPSMNIPYAITAGPDGALWFTNDDAIGRMTTTGVVTSYRDPSINRPNSIAVGPDSALWFTNYDGNTIGRITTSGDVTSYADPRIDGPWGIAAGPDGALWFTSVRNQTIGRITPEGVITTYSAAGIYPENIVAGADGALWFTTASEAIGRITMDGGVTTYADSRISHKAMGIAAGPDGALWFANFANGIGRISTDGDIAAFADPSIGAPTVIAAGPDGALWYSRSSCGEIGRITTAGVVSSYGNACIALGGVAAGPDGGMWFTTSGGNTIERIQPGPPLLGDPQLEPETDYNPDGMAEAFRATASADATLGDLSLYVDPASSAARLVVGVYTNASGHPAKLLGEATIQHPISGTSNTAVLPPVAITAGKRYWIAVLAPAGAGTVRFRDRCCGDSGPSPSETSAQQTLATLPATWQTGTVYENDGPLSAYAN